MEKILFKHRNFGEKLGDYWYYHKWHIIFAVFTLIVAVYGIVSCTTRTRYDLVIPMATHFFFEENWLVEMQDALAAHVEDEDGDRRERTVRISFSDFGNVHLQGFAQTQQTRFYAQLAAGDSFLVIGDERVMASLIEQEIVQNISGMAPDAAFEGYALQLRDHPIFVEAGVELPIELYIGLRQYEGTLAEGNRTRPIYERAERLFRVLAEARTIDN